MILWIFLLLDLSAPWYKARSFGCVYEITPWAPISGCSVTCGDGVMNYTRICCDKPHPQGKKECNGVGLEIVFMDIRICNIPFVGNGGWSDWSPWTVCPVTCEGVANNQNRTRTCTNPVPYCNGADCVGSSTQYQTCNTVCCPVDGGWSSWNTVGSCSVTCGGGIQSWIRSCTNPIPYCNGADCPGSTTTTTICNDVCCPVDGSWTDWGAWEACPVTCGGTLNNQIRTRSCTNPATFCGGIDCTISSGETNTSYTTCNTRCCPVDGGWAVWEEWYACPVTCGGGTHIRYRNCNDPVIDCGGAICPNCVGLFCNLVIQRDTGTDICNDFDCTNCGIREIGYGTPSTYTTTKGSNTGFGIIAESGFYRPFCCGVIKSWEYYASDAGELHLMVWRKSGSTYTLVGKNIYTVPSGAVNHTIKYTIREADRLTVRNNDMLGWYTPGPEIIPYSISEPHNFRMTIMGTIDEGITFDWASIVFVHNIAYALRVYTDYNAAPFFTNIQREFAVSDDKQVGGNIYKVQYYNGDTRDVITWTFTTSNSNISFNIRTEMIYLEATPTVGTYTMTFNITDSCKNTAYGTLTITVFNTPPRITSLPNFVKIHEDVKEGQLLHKLVVYDRQAKDTIKCSLTTVTPYTEYLTVHNIHLTSDYGVYVQPNAAFDYNTNKIYELSISCDDGKNAAVTGYFFVFIQKNHPPRFLNLPASIDLDASSTLIGDLLYTVQMEDDEDDTLMFNLTTEPSNGPFVIEEYGDILTTDDMSNIFTPAYNLKVTVNDGRTTVGTRTLSVRLANINDVPVISNLPLPHPFLIVENSFVGTTLFHVRVRDLDIADINVIYGDFNPNTGLSYFHINTDGFLSISSQLDYESIANTSFNIVLTATDGKNTATATISLSVTDENEGPVFHQTEYSVEQVESTQFTAFPSAGFRIYDPDASESFMYWLDCGNDTWRFVMDTTTGQITYAYNFDLDKVLTGQFNCLVRAKDIGFNTCTASLIVKIKDINDNSPHFNQTQFTFYTTPYKEVGTFIGSVTAYDIDTSEYGTLRYKLDMTSYSKIYFQIYDNGTLYVNTLLSSYFKYGDEMTFNLSAIDYGGLQTTVTVWIIFAKENSNDNSMNMPKTFFMSSKNALWLTAVGILTICMNLGTLYYCSKYWLGIDCVRTTYTTTNKGMKGKTHYNYKKGISRDKLTLKSVKKLNSIDIQRQPGNPLFALEKDSMPLKPINTSAAFTIITAPTESENGDKLKPDQITIGKISNLYKRKDTSSSPIALSTTTDF